MKRYEVSGFGVMEYEEVASTNSLAEKLPLSELKDKQVILTWRQTLCSHRNRYQCKSKGIPGGDP